MACSCRAHAGFAGLDSALAPQAACSIIIKKEADKVVFFFLKKNPVFICAKCGLNTVSMELDGVTEG